MKSSSLEAVGPLLTRCTPGALGAVLAVVMALFLMGLLPNPALGANRAANADSAKQALQMLDKGELAAAAGRFEEAARYWRRALEIKPAWPKAKARLAELPLRKKRFPAQMAALERGSRARLAYVEGVQEFNQGDYRAAADRFAACLDVYPQDQLAAKNQALSRAMQRDMGEGSLQVDCRPPGKAYLDGQLQGSTPLTLHQISIGRHQVAVEAYGARAVKEIEIKPRTLSSLALTLYGGRLEVTCQPDAEISLDGRRLGQSPLKMTGLPVGEHLLQASCPGYGQQKVKVLLKGNQATKLELKLRSIAKEK
jgi:tetratricopeptide (TPR) repeat protein